MAIQLKDPDVTLMFVASSTSNIMRHNTKAILDEKYNRHKLPQQYEQTFDDVWSRRRLENPSLWNGTKFRLHSTKLESDCFSFHLGITCYKDFITTNWSPQSRTFQELGIKEHNNTQAYMSDAMGVGSLLQTSDGLVIFMKRSSKCGEAVGLYDIPGGHAEPEELVGKIEAEDIKLDALSPADIVKEIYDSVLREIRDEVNIPLASLSEPVLIGIARNTTSAGRPSVEFFVKCNLSSEDVKKRYCQGDHAEADETEDIKFFSIQEVLNMYDKPFWKQLAPSAKGCVMLFCLQNSITEETAK
ncbi:nucleoside diphosphate-linked moiety X motif 22 [Lingula anatina]|uniref:Nucleoside diphosphate-linked moiety X motif 22 n=1 Tax=Lingula anatina TaxID=7574 RepID=A0A1S3KJ21_LINAN|nr:nucleoside diphosphate-linked moiety X motif 22 [Lingula anatina]|eukprot:XP_013422211.1 nucleoside diphosphate-linked moiety X motif 22 [Lingula anatina]